jgi:hypothetical protein
MYGHVLHSWFGLLMLTCTAAPHRHEEGQQEQEERREEEVQLEESREEGQVS